MVKITGEVYETMFQGLIKTQNYIDCLKLYLEETLEGVRGKAEKMREAKVDEGVIFEQKDKSQGEKNLSDGSKGVGVGPENIEGSWLMKL
jgi:hypothetical protein